MLFSRGWGDPETLERLSRPVPTEASPTPIEVVFDGAPKLRRGVLHTRATFESPASELLPEPHMRRARIELLLPEGKRPDETPVCTFLAAAGEQGFLRRRRFVRPLVEAGIGAVLLENPWYGERRPAGQTASLVRTVAEQLAMNRVTVREARAILEWLRARGHRKIGVSGYSMGGHMSVLTATRCTFPIAAIPCAAGLSPAPVFLEGELSRTVNWRALAKESGSIAGARERLGAILDQVKEYLVSAPKPQVAIIVGVRADGIVLPREVRALSEAWPDAELRWLEGGHVSAFVRHQEAMRRAVKHALDRV
jgi:dienelactone hydrolase